MTACASCSAPLPAASRFCPSCGAAASTPSQAPTVASDVTGPDHGPTSSGPARRSRFVAGEVLAARYRVEGLLGRGGMGEVYRAEDLKLGQTVALKFLPASLTGNPAMLARFHNEVRLSRHVTHPNVCRVHDLGEVDGQPFLSMEYVDGENLASLLRRIGRLPEDKAVEIARQLCAGLAAAHDRGVLHRDLKPENVMIDGRGTVRIMDFGLAAFRDEMSPGDLRSGTPAYMAPEQLEGREVTVRSDIYALGLVLHETFTGRQLFDAPTLDDLRRIRSSFDETALTLAGRHSDPAVESVIRRCLAADPKARPASALAVATALPGGDPLAAALAAGELPSPEMVAAAGATTGLRPALAWSCLAAAFVLFLIGEVVGSSLGLLSYVPFDRPSEALVERARGMLAAIGPAEPAVDAAWRFATNQEPLEWVARNDPSDRRWSRLANGRYAAVSFWYRQSPRAFEPANLLGRVGPNDPPRASVSGETLVVLDEEGRLARLEITPDQVASEEATREAVEDPADADAVWGPLFEAAGLERADFEPAASTWAPPVYADSRRAWTGTVPGTPELDVRIEAAAVGKRPVYFEIVFPWSRSGRMQPRESLASQRWAQNLNALLVLAGLVIAVWMARRNAVSGRGDRVGATRLGAWAFVTGLGEWACLAHHQRNLADELSLFIGGAGFALFVGSFCWALYLAIEPLVRRTWPQALVSWTRLLSGRWKDSTVGRDVLLGVLGACAVVFVAVSGNALAGMLGRPPTPAVPNLDSLLGARELLGGLCGTLVGALLTPMLIFLMLVGFKALLRRTALAVVLTMALLVPVFVLDGDRGGPTAITVAIALFIVSALLTLAARFGLLALVAALLTLQIASLAPTPRAADAWYFGTSLAVYATIAAIALTAWWIALGRARAPAA